MGRRCRRISPPQLALLPACQKGRENRPFNPFTINAEIRRFHRVERCGLWHGGAEECQLSRRFRMEIMRELLQLI
jgi:hypothetical protein